MRGENISKKYLVLRLHSPDLRHTVYYYLLSYYKWIFLCPNVISIQDHCNYHCLGLGGVRELKKKVGVCAKEKKEVGVNVS